MREQCSVAPLALQKLAVSARFDDATCIHHEDLIGTDDGGEPMRDDQDGLGSQQRFGGGLDPRLGQRVDVRRRLVEDDDRRLGGECAREREQLRLAHRDIRAPVCDESIESAEACDDLPRTCELDGFEDCIIGDLVSEGQIEANGPGKSWTSC